MKPAAKKRPEWVPTANGVSETVAPFRTMPDEYLAAYNAIEQWIVWQRRKPIAFNEAAFRVAWTRWACLRIKSYRKAEAKKKKPQIAGTRFRAVFGSPKEASSTYDKPRLISSRA